MVVRTEFDADYIYACYAEKADRDADARDNEPPRARPRYCHECRQSFGHAAGCPNEPPEDEEDE